MIASVVKVFGEVFRAASCSLSYVLHADGTTRGNQYDRENIFIGQYTDIFYFSYICTQLINLGVVLKNKNHHGELVALNTASIMGRPSYFT